MIGGDKRQSGEWKAWYPPQTTQTQLAEALGMTQPGISRIERQTDVYLSTLRSYVEALGGELRLVAEFPDGAIEIANLERLAEREPDHETGELGHADALTGHS